MPRLRALFAILLAVTWCSAAWHADLEALDLLSDHEHHAHDHSGTDHSPMAVHGEHEELVARNVANDPIRVGAGIGLWLAIIGAAALLAANPRPTLAALKSTRRRRESDPPLAHVWQFMQRCAPESAAPPALA